MKVLNIEITTDKTTSVVTATGFVGRGRTRTRWSGCHKCFNRTELVGTLSRIWTAVSKSAEWQDTQVVMSVVGDQTVDTSSLANAVADVERMLDDEVQIASAA